MLGISNFTMLASGLVPRPLINVEYALSDPAGNDNNLLHSDVNTKNLISHHIDDY